MSRGGWLLRVLLVVALFGLLAADRGLEERAIETRASSNRVGPFLPLDEQKDMLVAAVTVQRGEGPAWLYGRIAGVWRCLDLHRVPAIGHEVQQLLDGMRQAQGVVQSRERSGSTRYGLDTDSTWHITFHGPAVMKAPDRDVVLQVDVGSSRRGVVGSFLRRPGEDAIWAVDIDPRPVLESRGLPPMIDPHLVPAAWPGDGHVMSGITVQREGMGSFALERRELPPPPGRTLPGVTWVLVLPDGSEQDVQPLLTVSYLRFLTRAPWESILSPERLAELGVERPEGRLELRAEGIDPLVLIIGTADGAGRRPVVNTNLRCSYSMAPEYFSLLLPEPIKLQLATSSNPWDAWLDR